MKYLCLAYGDENDWKKLTRIEQDKLLAQDQVVRDRGNLVAAVGQEVMTVTAPAGEAEVNWQEFAELPQPLAGFSIIEAEDIEEVISLVKGTPCPHANGAIEIRPIIAINEELLAKPKDKSLGGAE
jgi:hypothetical protein